jgi:hypothetical protein
MAQGVALDIHGHRQAGDMAGLHEQVHAQGRDAPSQPLRTDDQIIDCLKEFGL